MKDRGTFFSDTLMSVLCAAGSCLCLFLFWKDINAAFSRLGEQPAGIITYRFNTAQRRFIDRVLWDRLRNDSPVYNGDLIRTADLSEAAITFSGGDIVNLTSNTLIQIFTDKNAPRIDFSGGGISVNASSGMVIDSGNKRLKVDAGAVLQAAAFRDGALDLAVSEGSAVLESPDYKKKTAKRASESRTISAGGALLVNAAGEDQLAPRAVAVFPPPDARFLSQNGAGYSVEFSWKKINYPAEGITRLEVSANRNFSRPLFEGNLNESSFRLTLPEGTWFWRLYPPAEGGGEIPYSKVRVVSNPIPALISPQEGQAFSYHSRFPALRFKWTSSRTAYSYILEAADNPSLQNPALSLNVRSGTGDQLSALSSALGDGTWYWKVTPVYSRDFSGNPTPSRTGSFVIRRGAELAAPVLTAPPDEAILNIEAGRRDVLFSWKKENEAASYILTISANSSMNSPIVEKTITGSYYRYGAGETVITPGTWYWTVRQKDSNGDVSSAPPPKTFTALRGEAVLRPVFPPDNYTIAHNLLPDMRFTWKTNLDDARFQLSQNADFTPLVINEPAVYEAHTVYSLRAGTYYWRITGGGTRRLESKPHRLIVAESLPPPQLNLPKGGSPDAQDGSVIIRQGQTLDFSWEPSAGAEYYSFKLFQNANKQTPVMETLVYGTGVSANMDNYTDGLYTWIVQGFARETASGSRRTGIASVQSVNIRRLYPAALEHP